MVSRTVRKTPRPSAMCRYRRELLPKRRRLSTRCNGRAAVVSLLPRRASVGSRHGYSFGVVGIWLEDHSYPGRRGDPPWSAHAGTITEALAVVTAAPGDYLGHREPQIVGGWRSTLGRP